MSSSCGPSRFAMQHESQEPVNLSRIRHQLHEDPRQPDCFFGQLAAESVSSHHVVPADPKSCVDRIDHGIEPLRQITLFWNFEADTTVTDLSFGTHQTLSHSFR